MAKNGETLGLTLHSNFARHYAAAKRENPIGHAEETGAKLDHALALQDSHWAMLGAHMLGRNGEYEGF